MPRNFYYGKDAQVVSGSANFSSIIGADYAALGLTSAQATGFATINTTLQNAFTAAITPETRTPVAIETKNIAIDNMRRQAVLLSKIIYATPAVTDAQLVSLGLLPRNLPTPAPIPNTPPVVDVLSVTGRLVKVRIHAAEGESGRKPYGCAGAQVYSYVGATAPTDPREYHYEGLATREKCEILFPNTVASGATVWIAAGWVTQRGFPCVACTPVQVTLQGGPVLAAAA
ncbi:MAG: hypothetical protein H0T11_04420 [Chthoniobacterales bacterium]|nr:hypothetical protein [Chthoniobacterales bacterium]